MALSPEKTKSLMALLRSEHSFSDISSEFSKSFTVNRSFFLCCCLSILLEDKVILSLTERLVAFAIMFQQPPPNHFLSFPVDAAYSDDNEDKEREFILELTSGKSDNIKEILGLSTVDYNTSYDCSSIEFLQRTALNQKDRKKRAKEAENVEEAKNAYIILLENILVKSSKLVVQPSMKHEPSTLPQRLPVFSSELKWVNPSNVYELLRDIEWCDNSENLEELIPKASKGLLAPAEQECVIQLLNEEKDLDSRFGLTPEKFPELVNNNPQIASEVLIKMNFPEILEYFSVLGNMNISQCLMEVVNKLSTSVELPMDFVQKYTANCISSFEKIEDERMEDQLLRHVCVVRFNEFINS